MQNLITNWSRQINPHHFHWLLLIISKTTGFLFLKVWLKMQLNSRLDLLCASSHKFLVMPSLMKKNSSRLEPSASTKWSRREFRQNKKENWAYHSSSALNSMWNMDMRNIWRVDSITSWNLLSSSFKKERRNRDRSSKRKNKNVCSPVKCILTHHASMTWRRPIIGPPSSEYQYTSQEYLKTRFLQNKLS